MTMENQSKYDPTRQTLGAEYQKLLKNRPKERVEVGDMRNELMSSLVTDLNEELNSLTQDPKAEIYFNRPYYVRLSEKRDYIMADVFRRDIYRTLYRPYPEPDTLVFWRSADRNDIKFCWQLPEKHNMRNMLENSQLFSDRAEELRLIESWMAFDLTPFGFVKDEMGNWHENLDWKKDLTLKSLPPSGPIQLVVSV